MVCPFCGHITATGESACAACGRALPPAAEPEELTELSRPPSATHADDVATIAPRSSTSQSRITRHTAGPLANGQILNGRYHVIRVLGKGGMGAVYHAWDEELGVGVALKVILPSADDDPHILEEMERRFKKELLLARQITHRNVVRIHDIGEVEGIKFITMPYIKGQDLATMLRAGPLPVPRALDLARQIVAGLAAAHDAGVVHRDLKPANIMIDEETEHALLMDFGIARSVRGTSKGTLAGTVIGTIDYMAPEQARGEMADARADIYAVGLILYEMLAGRRRLTGDGAVSDLMARMSAAPAAVRTLKPEIPAELDAIVTKCLSPAAEHRYQSCAELLSALDGLDQTGRTIVKPERTGTHRVMAVAAVLIVLAAAAAYWVASGGAPVEEAPREPVSVLIADFDNQVKDPIFTGTLEQMLGLAIEGAPFIASFPRSAAQRAADQLNPGSKLDESTARLVSRREGIQVVLAGAVTRENDQYHLSVRALDGATGAELSTSSAAAQSKNDVLGAVSRVAAAVRRSLGDVTPESKQIAAAETFTASSLEAARAYEEAQQLQRAGNVQGAVAAYQRVITLDPGLGRAYAGLAVVYANAGQREEADRHFKLAMARLDRMSERERYRTLSNYYLFTRNTAGAIEQLTELLQKYPADTAAMANLAFARFNRREFGEAMDLGKKAASVYSTAITRTNVALYAMYAGHFDAALAESAAALKINERHAKAHLAAALAHLASGRVAEAVAAYNRLQPINASLAASGLADLALYEGRGADAAAILEKGAAADGADGHTSAAARKLTTLAQARRLQGRNADAVRLLQQAVNATDGFEVRTEAALAYIDLGMPREAAALAEPLRGSLQPDSQAYARVIDGHVLLARNQPREAVTAFIDAQKLADTWLGRFGLGRAYLQLPQAATEAYAALEACVRRRGEATAVFLDDVPTYHRLAPVYYYLGLAQAGVGSPAAAESFKTFLSIKQRGDDPLVAAARQQLNR
jgi:Flp pilus assembly protein TadD